FGRVYPRVTLLRLENSRRRNMSRKNIAIFLVLIVLVTAAVVSARWFHGRNDSTLQGSGTVEARYIRVGSKVGGRIDKVLVREGDSVKAGQVLVTFDDKELQAALGQSRAAWEKAHRGSRPEDIAAARSDLDRANAEEVRTRNDFERYDALAKKDLVSRQQRDAAEAAWRVAAPRQQKEQQKIDELQ